MKKEKVSRGRRLTLAAKPPEAKSRALFVVDLLLMDGLVLVGHDYGEVVKET